MRCAQSLTHSLFRRCAVLVRALLSFTALLACRDQVVTSFDDMNLKDELLRGIYAYGFEKPSAIQQRGIMPVLAGHDTIAQAQSGTGKTATFSIAVLQQIDLKQNKWSGSTHNAVKRVQHSEDAERSADASCVCVASPAKP